MRITVNHFKTNIRYLRKQKGFTLQDMADMTDSKHRSNACDWERGDCFPNMEKLLTISHVFRITINDLIETDLRNHTGKLHKPRTV